MTHLPITLPRVIRDPLHGDIRLTEFEWQLLNTRECQRLRWIKQLGFANLVYPGAEHSRLSHSIGTLFTADRILRSIEERTGTPFDAEERLMARCYALLHDISHIPYGHTLEDELGLYSRHDGNSGRLERLLFSESSEVGKVLRTTGYGKTVLGLFETEAIPRSNTHIKALIDGPTSADVLDYIDRDAYFCGLDHRVDSAIYRRFSFSDQRQFVSRTYGGHGFRLDADFALESVLRERFALFLKVYTHPAKVAAGAMLGKAVAELMRSGEDRLDPEDLEWMGDAELLVRLKSSPNRLCASLADRLLTRRLYKPAFRARVIESADSGQLRYSTQTENLSGLGILDPEGRHSLDRIIAAKSSIGAGDVIVYCTPAPPGLKKFRHHVESGPDNTQIRDEKHDPYHRMMMQHLPLWVVYVFLAPNHGQKNIIKVGGVAADVLQLPNEAGVDRKEAALR
jgi:uncharacterized protein